ncbi:MAG: gliding motility lipoprotein GldH [Bacteroidetes bacterium]|nr:gliding motility lipoprotein GldH [Bacteroidota bacterium]MBS1932009.1 gliding motility lipoprotein GldH [Bacteroidota bacterium]
MKSIRKILLILLCCIFCLASCTSVDLYEKEVALPGHEWKSSFKPGFTFTIKDTTAPYQFFLVLRHTEKYNYTNIYVNLYVQAPGTDSVTKIQRSLMLADNNGWMGSGMDDIYEHRIPLGDPQLLKAGTYTFTLEQIMREDPLEHVLNVGLRIEKKK